MLPFVWGGAGSSGGGGGGGVITRFGMCSTKEYSFGSFWIEIGYGFFTLVSICA